MKGSKAVGADASELRRRSTQEVFDDHVARLIARDRPTDLVRNYAEDAVVLSSVGTFRGRSGANYIDDWIHCGVPWATIEVTTRLVAGEIAFLEWSAHGERAEIWGGANSYLIRNGQIVVQTIHFLISTRDSAD
jgi:hypothetical protein